MPRIKKQYSTTLSDETIALLQLLGERMVDPMDKHLNRSLTIEALALFASQSSTKELQAFTLKHGIKGRESYPNSLSFEAILTAVQIQNAGRKPFNMKTSTVAEYLEPYLSESIES
tara:strand:+ start:3984 stop:4331 length:348 start_codon:yes stop_codon:yes gene_type:complete